MLRSLLLANFRGLSLVYTACFSTYISDIPHMFKIRFMVTEIAILKFSPQLKEPPTQKSETTEIAGSAI
jgi:hypothetical protein